MSLFAYEELEKEIGKRMADSITPVSKYKEVESGYALWNYAVNFGNLIHQVRSFYNLFDMCFGYDIVCDETYPATKGRKASVYFTSMEDEGNSSIDIALVGITDTFRFLAYSSAVLQKKDLVIAIIIAAFCNELLIRDNERLYRGRRSFREVDAEYADYLNTLKELKRVASDKMEEAHIGYWNEKCKYYIRLDCGKVKEFESIFLKGPSEVADSFLTILVDFANEYKGDNLIMSTTIMDDGLHAFFSAYSAFYNEEITRLEKYRAYEDKNLLEEFEYESVVCEEYLPEIRRLRNEAEEHMRKFPKDMLTKKLEAIKNNHPYIPSEEEMIYDTIMDRIKQMEEEHSKCIKVYTALEELCCYCRDMQSGINRLSEMSRDTFKSGYICIEEDVLDLLIEHYYMDEILNICLKSKEIAEKLIEKYNYTELACDFYNGVTK